MSDALDQAGGGTEGQLTDSGTGGGFDWGGMFGAIDGSIQNMADVVTGVHEQYGQDPCGAVFARDATISQLKTTITQVSALAERISSKGRREVARALAKNGEADSRYVGSTALAIYLADLGILDNIPTVPPPGPFRWDFVRNRLPPPGTAPLGTRSSGYKGAKIGNGVYVYGGSGHDNAPIWHLNHGTIRGDTARSAWFTWEDRIKNGVAPVSFSSWRAKLAALTGDPAGVWYVWKSGDPVSETSRLGTLAVRLDDQESMRTADRVECERRTAFGEDAETTQSDFERGEESRKTTLLFLAGIAALWAYTQSQQR